MVKTGIGALDSLTGGIPRIGMTEIYGPLSSGRMTLPPLGNPLPRRLSSCAATAR